MEILKGIFACSLFIATSAFSNFTLFNNSDDTLIIKYQFCESDWGGYAPTKATCTDKTQTPSIFPHSEYQVLNGDPRMAISIVEADVMSQKGSFTKQFEKVNLFVTACSVYNNNRGLLFNTFDEQEDVSCTPGSGSLVG